MSRSSRVIVVGAGPTGLMLACELALAGVPCRVLERRAWRTSESRAFVLHARTMELLDMRGHADQVQAYGKPVERLRVGVDGGVDFSRLDSRFAHLTILPQSLTEDVLETRARDLGVEIVREADLDGLEQHEDGVTVRVSSAAGSWVEDAAYVVGCDGANSAVRDLAGIPFEGVTHEYGAVLADVRLRRPPVDDMLLLGSGRGSALVLAAYADGWYRIACLDGTVPYSSDEPVDLERFSDLMLRATGGHDMQPYAPRWISRFRLHERLAARYRSGRVLLAGDAAHLHSPIGGQGLNLGIQDSVNLGWKLAAVATGRRPAELLDSYETERRPVAATVIKTTAWVTRTVLGASPMARLARNRALPYLLASSSVQRRTREAMAGIAVNYPAPRSAGPLRGTRVPDMALELPGGQVVRLYELLREGKFVLVDFGPYGAAAAETTPWGDQVKAVVADACDPAWQQRVTAFLVRPDGHAAWSTRAKTPAARAAACRVALERWCGPEEKPQVRHLARLRSGVLDGSVDAPGF